jgi:cytidine deaminase
MTNIQKKLLNASKEAAKHAYAPYSKFRVGAAVYANKKIYRGANIENASSNLGICAERVAIAHARINGANKIEGIAIFCIDASVDDSQQCMSQQCMPCGACLQWLAELAPNAWIVNNFNNKAYVLSDLLPKPFSLSIQQKK